MDARQLDYFLAIVEHDGFGRAAEQLHIAQPSLSQSIATLERELGVPLFHRIGRGIVLPTPARELVAPARQVLRDLRHRHGRRCESTRGLQRGRVELVTMPSPGIEPLTTMTRRFTDAHPAHIGHRRRRVHPRRGRSDVKSGQAEVRARLGSARPAPNTAPGVDVLPLEDQPFVLVAPRPTATFPEVGDPVPHGPPVDLAGPA